MNEDLQWQAFFKRSVDGPEAAATEPELPSAREAVAAAFELYRQYAVN
jgi:hypothetical protein